MVAMSKAPVLHVETVVDATPEQVWEALADFGGWDAWNPTLFHASGPPAVGSQVRMTLRLGPFKVPMRQQILAINAPHELVWRSLQPVQSALDVVRRFNIEALEGGRSRLLQSETTNGFLGAIEVRLLGKAITKGYRNLGQALGQRVAAGGAGAGTGGGGDGAGGGGGGA